MEDAGHVRDPEGAGGLVELDSSDEFGSIGVG